mmetsp:Transcript_76250/g.128155  ORF Transcript_76250/g.128155 Transcript_76250/m.128155 type:complete len:89 (+) Transcript_76250:29-295(+)
MYPWSDVGALWSDGFAGHVTLPPLCESNALVRATAGAVSAILGTVEFGASFFWWPMTIKFFLWFGAGGGIATHLRPFLFFGGGDWGIT